MEMFAGAISAASALCRPQCEIDDLYCRGIAKESQGVDLAHSRDMINCVMQSLDLSLIGMDDEQSLQIMKAVHEEIEKKDKEYL